MDCVKSFMRGMRAVTMTSLAVCRGGHGLTKKESQEVGVSSQDDEPKSSHREPRGPRLKTL